jgi:hypothetical protein
MDFFFYQVKLRGRTSRKEFQGCAFYGHHEKVQGSDEEKRKELKNGEMLGKVLSDYGESWPDRRQQKDSNKLDQLCPLKLFAMMISLQCSIE